MRLLGSATTEELFSLRKFSYGDFQTWRVLNSKRRGMCICICIDSAAKTICLQCLFGPFAMLCWVFLKYLDRPRIFGKGAGFLSVARLLAGLPSFTVDGNRCGSGDESAVSTGTYNCSQSDPQNQWPRKDESEY